MADRKKGVLLPSPLLSLPFLSGGRGADYDGWMQPPSSSSSSVSALFMAPVAISWRAGKRGKAPLQEVFLSLEQFAAALSRSLPGNWKINYARDPGRRTHSPRESLLLSSILPPRLQISPSLSTRSSQL